jgi:hypothetical protein
MIEERESEVPDGREESESAEVGQPDSGRERRELREDERPNLDDREQRISTRRKPMGPPLEKPEETREEDREDRDEGAAPGPVDPA